MFVCIFFGSSLDIIVIMADLHCKDMVVGGGGGSGLPFQRGNTGAQLELFVKTFQVNQSLYFDVS